MSENSQSKASLYIVATPIGNLADMTGRAIEVLKSVDLIAAEDTRHSSRLLQHFGIGTRMMSYHDFSEDYRVDSLLEKLSSGLSVALISDAGTPLISDPGYRLVMRARAAGITVVPVPGVCALTTALSVAGLPSDRFAFEGFVSAKRASRVKQFEEWLPEARTMIFYESPHRILECVEDMLTVFGPDRHVVLCRELTKTFETIHGDNLGDLLPWMQNDSNQQRGEFVVLIKGAEAPKSEEVDAEALRVLGILLEDLSVKQAASLAARITGVKKNLLYQRALQGVMVS